jgi:hypothetical protein
VSSSVVAINITPPAISPTKEEVKEERDMLHTIATDFERKLESSNKKIETLASKSKSLANSLKTEKLKSRSTMEQLLLLTTTQTEELIASFHDRFTQLKTEHDSAVRKLHRISDSERIDNQKCTECLLRSHDKQMKQLNGDYTVALAEMEEAHNKKIVSFLCVILWLVDSNSHHCCYGNAGTGTAEEGCMHQEFAFKTGRFAHEGLCIARFP